jgi:hypothetical protein
MPPPRKQRPGNAPATAGGAARDLHLIYEPAYAGGVRLSILAVPAGKLVLALVWRRQAALDAVASILRAAGIRYASYEGGVLTAEDGT